MNLWEKTILGMDTIIVRSIPSMDVSKTLMFRGIGMASSRRNYLNRTNAEW